jgi:hypothetical protein
MNPPKYRAIISSRQGRSQRQLFESFVEEKTVFKEIETDSTVPINKDLVPRIVDGRQFDAIQLRRKVRSVIESARINTGNRWDGRRDGTFKYAKRHEAARTRLRDSGGTFLSLKPEDNKHVLAIWNS